MFKRTIAALTVLVAMLCFAVKVDAAKPTQWLIYWYVCGTDIETTRIAFGSDTDLMSDDPNALRLAEPDRRPGDATFSIKEVERADLSSDVRIFMQAGGTYVWGHEKFRDLNAKINTAIGYVKDENGEETPITVYKAPSVSVRQWFLSRDQSGNTVAKPVQFGKIGRYVYDRDHRNWHPREQLPIITQTVTLEDGTLVDVSAPNTETDMGSKAGFVSFLRAGQKLERELYPDGNVRRLLILKDHGSGLSVCSDEYTQNIIHVDEIKQAFTEVQGGWTNPDEKPFEVVAFDACLMSTYEAAFALEESANYMVASQETTFGKGNFNHTALLNELSKNPAMNGKELGKIICNTGWEDSKIVDKEFGYNSNALFTLSVIDLSAQKMDALKTAYANFSEAVANTTLKNLDDVAYTFAKFKNAANVAERYPSDKINAWLIDLRNFAENVKATFPELKAAGGELVGALDKAVVYNKRGDVLSRGGGLSKQFPTDFYNVLQSTIQSKSEELDLSNLSATTIEVDEETKTARVELNEEDLKRVESVRYQLAYLKPYFDAEGNEKFAALYLGGDNTVKENRQTGIVESAFNGKWVTLDGNPLPVQVVSDSSRKNKDGKKIGGKDICISPVWINNVAYKLYFVRNYPGGKVTVIGAVRNLDAKVTLPNNDLESLKKGDVVVPQYFQINKSMDELENARSIEDVLEVARGNSIIIGDKPKIEMSTLGDGLYLYAFQFINPLDQSALSGGGAVFKIKNGKVVGVKHVADLEDFSDIKDFDAQ